MNVFSLTVSSPDGNVFSGECEKLDVIGVEGALAVMAGHVPFVTSVKKGPCVLHLPDDRILKAESEGGLLSVGREKVTFLSGTFTFCED